MELNLEYLPGQTPIDEEEKDGLKIKTIEKKGELDEFEQKILSKLFSGHLAENIKPIKSFQSHL